MLLDSFEFLIHVDDWIENQGEQVNRVKDTEFVAKLIFSSRNMKLLVTSSQNFEFPSLEKEKITQGAFKPEQTFQLLKTVWKSKTVYKTWAINFQIYVVIGVRAISCRGGGTICPPKISQVAKFLRNNRKETRVILKHRRPYWHKKVAQYSF